MVISFPIKTFLIDYLNNFKFKNGRGGRRKENTKVSKRTLKCLIALILDFPTIPPNSYATYINSQFGPNYEDNISERTIQRYLSSLDFKLKVSFSPPNRNSVGLRIFRVAWSKFMEKISFEENALLGYVDEASVSSSEGKRFYRRFCGISKIKMTIMACVFPGFGVLYKKINNSAGGSDYANFINEVTLFYRKYFYNNETNIVLIEDNCPMHSNTKVKHLINELKIALIPIVPYSPSLNGVVEGYFGFIKTHN